MRLVDLNPRWIGSGPHAEDIACSEDGQPPRHGIGVAFDCPCGCIYRCTVFFNPPLDGGKPIGNPWSRTGDTFDTLTLTPSIHRVGGCVNQWHGLITHGEVITC